MTIRLLQPKLQQFVQAESATNS